MCVRVCVGGGVCFESFMSLVSFVCVELFVWSCALFLCVLRVVCLCVCFILLFCCVVDIHDTVAPLRFATVLLVVAALSLK